MHTPPRVRDEHVHVHAHAHEQWRKAEDEHVCVYVTSTTTFIQPGKRGYFDLARTDKAHSSRS